MRTKFNKIPDDLQYQIVQEYLTTEITYDELKVKYNFGGNDNIRNWMTKFGISKQNVEQIKLDRVMSSTNSNNSRELELELKIRLLEDELNKLTHAEEIKRNLQEFNFLLSDQELPALTLIKDSISIPHTY